MCWWETLTEEGRMVRKWTVQQTDRQTDWHLFKTTFIKILGIFFIYLLSVYYVSFMFYTLSIYFSSLRCSRVGDAAVALPVAFCALRRLLRVMLLRCYEDICMCDNNVRGVACVVFIGRSFAHKLTLFSLLSHCFLRASSHLIPLPFVWGVQKSYRKSLIIIVRVFVCWAPGIVSHFLH